MAVQIPEMLENGKTHKPEREKSGKWKRERERERNPSAWKEREKMEKRERKMCSRTRVSREKLQESAKIPMQNSARKLERSANLRNLNAKFPYE